ncbi:MFS transporter [Micromonospora sp. NPDC002717]|uniref:MFS transporter n=1 Tax=Micromonospora sp. NPDC002717 TaxID=3154424 RepID=UPI003333E226
MIPPGYPAQSRPSMVRPPWSLAGPALSAFLAAGLLIAPVGPLVSAITRDLGLSTAGMTMTVVAQYVVATVALVAPGYLLGRRWPTAIALPALALLIIGSVVSAFTPGAALFAVGRVIVGLGAGTAAGAALALASQLVRGRSRARLALGLALGAALLLGPVVSGMLAQALSWRTALLADVLVATVALFSTIASGIAMWVLRPSQPSPPATPAATTPRPGATWIGDPGR